MIVALVLLMLLCAGLIFAALFHADAPTLQPKPIRVRAERPRRR